MPPFGRIAISFIYASTCLSQAVMWCGLSGRFGTKRPPYRHQREMAKRITLGITLWVLRAAVQIWGALRATLPHPGCIRRGGGGESSGDGAKAQFTPALPTALSPEKAKRRRIFSATVAGVPRGPLAQAGLRASCQARGAFRKASTSSSVAASKAPCARASASTSHQVQR
jgi:hypothetical protein